MMKSGETQVPAKSKVVCKMDRLETGFKCHKLNL